MSSNKDHLRPVKDSLAIDLGTGTCTMGVSANGKAKILKVGGSTIVPTAVYLNADGSTIVGKPAERKGAIDPANFAASYKPAIRDEGETVLIPHASFTVVDGFAAMFAYLLMVIRQLAPYLLPYPQFGGTKKNPADFRFSVTVPANGFGLPVIAKYRKALVQAGYPEKFVEDVAFIKEPYAAAHAAMGERGLRGSLMNGDMIVVLDIGDGTSDFTLVEYRGGLLHCTAHSGVSDLGGSNETAAVAKVIASKLGTSFNAWDRKSRLHFSAVPEQQRADQYGIWVAASESKVQFQTEDTAFAVVATKDGNKEVSITLDEFNTACEPLFVELDEAILRALDGTNVSWSTVKYVVLAGGASLTRGRRDRIANTIGRPVDEILVCDEPQHAIVSGAVVMGQTPQDVTTVLTDGFGLSYPEAGTGRAVYEVYAENGATIPASGLDMERATTKVISKGQPQELTLYPFLAKSGVMANVGDLLKDTEVIPLDPVVATIDLPAGEHDVVVRLRFDITQRATAILSFPGVPNSEHIVVALRVGENGTLPKFECQQKSLIYLIDTSGSMSDEPIREAKAAAKTAALQDIAKSTEVCVVSFGGTVDVNQPTTNGSKIAQFIDSLSATGGTPMGLALETAEKYCHGTKQYIAILYSDGYPGNAQQVHFAASELRKVAQLYTIAIGADADENLLRSIATSPNHFVPIGRASDLKVAYESISTLIYTGDTQVIAGSVPLDIDEADEWEDDDGYEWEEDDDDSWSEAS